MNLKFNLEEKVSLKHMIEYFSLWNYPIIMEKLDSDKKWINNKTYENFINVYNKDLNFSNLPEVKNHTILGIYNVLQEINFVKVKTLLFNNNLKKDLIIKQISIHFQFSKKTVEWVNKKNIYKFF